MRFFSFFIIYILFSFQLNSVEAEEFSSSWDLRRCLREALRRRPALRGMRAFVKGKRSNVGLEIQKHWPSLDLKGTYKRLKYTYNPMSPMVMKDSKDDFLFGASLKWNLTKHLVVAQQVERARREYEAAKASLEILERRISLDVVLAYFRVLRSSSLMEVALASLEKARLHLRYAVQAQKAGKGSPADLLKAKMTVMRTKLAKIKAQTRQITALATLRRVLGLPQKTRFQMTRHFPAQKPSLHCDSTYRERPEERLLKARYLAAKANLNLTWRSFIPSLSLIGSVDFQRDRFFPDRLNWYAGISLKIPLSRYSGMLGKANKQRSIVIQAFNALKSLRQDLALQRTKSCLALKEAKATLLAAQAFLASAKENLRVAEGRYANGLDSMLNLNDARVSLITAKAEWIKALTQAHTAFLQDRFVRGFPILPSFRSSGNAHAKK